MKLSLYYPVNPIYFNQKFGNPAQIYLNQGMLGHNGIDLAAKHGEPVYASHDGFASFQVDNAGGHGVVIITKDKFDYNGGQSYFKTIYWHLCDGLLEAKYTSPIADKTGFTPVKAGDLIGYADNTGQSSGDHLHFGLKPVEQGENWGVWYNTQTNNGYMGAIDPQPYFNGQFLTPTPTNYKFYRDLSFGSQGEDVVELQKRLGVSPTAPNFGPKTKAAVIAYQKANNISPAAGYVGRLTRNILNK